MLETFETERLILRERTIEDLEDCLEMDCEEEVVKYIPEVRELLNSQNKHIAFVKERIETKYPNGLGYWTIESKVNNGEFIGWILLIPIDNVGPEIEIGWRLKRDYWGAGYATEAARAILTYAFDTVDLENVVADIHPSNRGSIRVAEKLVFTVEDSVNENSDDYVRYSIFRG
ncbi:GNAT family N-acetyltransferase [Salimicrobium jeotgali]|uniref:GNAT family N-acetyltransferase n=1 Tax=Salimicrobium jeotgali TaxID=1230341 RepID=UPI000C861894|nr:GNAT family N-acetyltransferase [Salimicrobium jeotgali]